MMQIMQLMITTKSLVTAGVKYLSSNICTMCGLYNNRKVKEKKYLSEDYYYEQNL